MSFAFPSYRFAPRARRWAGVVVALAIAAGALAPASARAAAAGVGNASDESTLLVQFQPGTSPAAARAVVADHGALLGEAIDHTGFFVVSTAGVAVSQREAVRAALAADPRVAVVERNEQRAAAAVPDDPRYGPNQSNYLAPLHLPEAWDLTTGSDDAVLAVVDSGVAPTAELASRLLPGRDVVNDDDDATDDFGHGTQVASVAVAATNNGSGMAGVAWRGRILPVKVLDKNGKGSDSTIAAGITWAADHGADVINLSLGAPASSVVLRAAVDYARSKDVLVVAAAGNDRSSSLNFPAAINGVVAVSAVDPDGFFASYSNWGPWIDLAAPGDVLAVGKDGAYKLVQGTSFAASVVSGVALLARSRYPDESADQIVTRLRSGARDAGMIGFDNRYGYGVVDALGAVGGPKPPRADDPARLRREPDNTPVRATLVAADEDVDGVLAPEGDVDWFATDLTSPRWIRVSIATADPPAGGSPVGWAKSPETPDAELFAADLSGVDDSGQEIENGQGSGYAYAPAGRMYVRVRIPNANIVGAVRYTLRIETIPAPARVFHPVQQERDPSEQPLAVALGDVTGDGRADVVVGFAHRFNSNDPDGPAVGSVGVYDDAAGFAYQPALLTAPAGSDGTTGVAVGDLDGDGDGDIAAATAQGVVTYAQSGGVLGAGRLVALAGADQVELGDVDGDGRLDIVVTTRPAGVVWLRNTGGGGFSAQPVSSAAVAEVEVADVDGDGRAEVLSLDCAKTCATASVADFAAGGFTTTTNGTGLTGADPSHCGLGVGDITGDGLADAFAACSDVDRVEVLRGQTGGGFLPAVSNDGELGGPEGLEAADLDGDGRAELAVLLENTQNLLTLRAAADGTLTPLMGLDVRTQRLHAKSFGFADLDGDGTVDIAAVDGEDNMVGTTRRQVVASEFGGLRAWVRDSVPVDGSTMTPSDTAPVITFARPLDPAVADDSVTMTDGSTGAPVDVTSTYDAATNSVAVRPAEALQPGHAYVLDYSALRDTDGNGMTVAEPKIRFAVAPAGSAPVHPADDNPAPPEGTPPPQARPARSGYWMVGTDGSVYGFGDAGHYGRTEPGRGGEVVDIEPTPSGDGYWLVDSLGTVTARGDAVWYGNAERTALAAGERITSLSATPTGRGYWLFTSLGRVVTRGDATWLGDMSAVRLNRPVLDSIPTPTGRGYYMVASDGGIFAFGDAAFAGSMGGKRLNAAVQSLVPDPDGAGYWLVASDGGVFAFEAPFRGSMGGRILNRPITGMVPSGDGYLMVGEDGGLFSFSNRPFAGSLGADPPAAPITAVAALN